MFDTLENAKTLKSAGMPEAQAEAMMVVLGRVAEGTLATKLDIQKLDTKIDKADTGLDTKIDKVEARLTARIDKLETELNAKIDKLEAGLNAKIDALGASLRGEMKVAMETLFHQITVRFGLMLVGMTGIFLAAIKLMLP